MKPHYAAAALILACEIQACETTKTVYVSQAQGGSMPIAQGGAQITPLAAGRTSGGEASAGAPAAAAGAGAGGVSGDTPVGGVSGATDAEGGTLGMAGAPMGGATSGGAVSVEGGAGGAPVVCPTTATLYPAPDIIAGTTPLFSCNDDFCIASVGAPEWSCQTQKTESVPTCTYDISGARMHATIADGKVITDIVFSYTARTYDPTDTTHQCTDPQALVWTPPRTHTLILLQELDSPYECPLYTVTDEKGHMLGQHYIIEKGATWKLPVGFPGCNVFGGSLSTRSLDFVVR